MLDTYLELHRERTQTSRVTLLRLFGTIDGESTLADFERGIRTPPPASDARWLAIPGVKIFADGIPPLATAWVDEPYADGTTGGLLTRGEPDARTAFRRMLELASARGMQIAVHATGDRSIAEFLSVLERRHSDHPTPAGPPHYVVHGDLATTAQIARMGRIGAGFAVQPLIAAHTHSWAAVQLGEARLATAWPLAEMLTSDALTTVTSDSPIASPDWRLGLDASLALLTAAGIANDAQSRNRLLRSMTVEAARQDGASAWKGSLEVGRVADLTVLDEDPLTPRPRLRDDRGRPHDRRRAHGLHPRLTGPPATDRPATDWPAHTSPRGRTRKRRAACSHMPPASDPPRTSRVPRHRLPSRCGRVSRGGRPRAPAGCRAGPPCRAPTTRRRRAILAPPPRGTRRCRRSPGTPPRAARRGPRCSASSSRKKSSTVRVAPSTAAARRLRKICAFSCAEKRWMTWLANTTSYSPSGAVVAVSPTSTAARSCIPAAATASAMPSSKPGA